MRRTPPEVVEKIRALRAEGKKLAEIAVQCGVSESIVSRYLLDSKLPAQRAERPAPDSGQQPTNATSVAKPVLPEQPRPLLSIRERGPGERLRGLLVGAGEMVAAIGGQVEVVVSVRRVDG